MGHVINWKTPFSAEGRTKAINLLAETLGNGYNQLASDLVEAFIKKHGVDARGRLRALRAALRSNADFAARVQSVCSSVVEKLVEEDPQTWANANIKAQRERWSLENFAMVTKSMPGTERPCPACGGKAIMQTGTCAGYKISKEYVHYKCTENECGKESHF